MRSEWRVEGKRGRIAFLVEEKERRKEAVSRARKFDTGELRDTRRAEVTAFHYFHFFIGLVSRRRADRYGEGGRGHLTCSRRRSGRSFRVAASLDFCLGWSLAR